MSDVKLPHFSEAMHNFVIEALDNGKRPAEVTVLFPLVFPNFGLGVDPDKVKDSIFDRVRKRKKKLESEGKLKASEQTPEASKRKICASATYRLSLLIDLYNKTPHVLSGEKQDKDNSVSLLKILDGIRLEMDRIDGFDGESVDLNTPTSKMGSLIPSPKLTGGRNANPREEVTEESGDASEES